MLLLCCVSAVMAIFLQPALSITYNCSDLYNRVPDNNDLTVDCGAIMINLKILNEGPDASGPFSFFSSIQSFIITGYLDTPKSSVGIILYYHFSCRYPLEYLLNNTQIVASSVSVATSDNNGTFIDTLSMSVFNDTDYGHPLVIPPTGLELRSKVYVEVKATNLTGKEVNLNLSTGCSVDLRSSVTRNGISKNSRFSFEAFRFVTHNNLERSSIYLHYSGGVQSGGDRVNITGLVVGILFGTAAIALVVLGSWFVLKKFYWAGGLSHAFD
ncbi:unnamed protein product [Coregonus sp. 'balchen']|nr:unnamed protein product [Coregonus sp. 'balchen']